MTTFFPSWCTRFLERWQPALQTEGGAAQREGSHFVASAAGRREPSLVNCRTCPVVKVTASFTSSDSQGFVLSDELGLTTDDPPTVNVRERELVYRSLPDGEYYWELPDSFTGNKVRYGDCVSLRSTPVHLHRQNSPVQFQFRFISLIEL